MSTAARSLSRGIDKGQSLLAVPLLTVHGTKSFRANVIGPQDLHSLHASQNIRCSIISQNATTAGSSLSNGSRSVWWSSPETSDSHFPRKSRYRSQATKTQPQFAFLRKARNKSLARIHQIQAKKAWTLARCTARDRTLHVRPTRCSCLPSNNTSQRRSGKSAGAL